MASRWVENGLFRDVHFKQFENHPLVILDRRFTWICLWRFSTLHLPYPKTPSWGSSALRTSWQRSTAPSVSCRWSLSICKLMISFTAQYKMKLVWVFYYASVASLRFSWWSCRVQESLLDGESSLTNGHPRLKRRPSGSPSPLGNLEQINKLCYLTTWVSFSWSFNPYYRVFISWWTLIIYHGIGSEMMTHPKFICWGRLGACVTKRVQLRLREAGNTNRARLTLAVLDNQYHEAGYQQVLLTLLWKQKPSYREEKSS